MTVVSHTTSSDVVKRLSIVQWPPLHDDYLLVGDVDRDVHRWKISGEAYRDDGPDPIWNWFGQLKWRTDVPAGVVTETVGLINDYYDSLADDPDEDQGRALAVTQLINLALRPYRRFMHGSHADQRHWAGTDILDNDRYNE